MAVTGCFSGASGVSNSSAGRRHGPESALKNDNARADSKASFAGFPRELQHRTNHEAEMKLNYFFPLLGFVIPTVGIGFGFVIPRSCIAGINGLTMGFAITVVGACVTCWLG